MAFSMAWMTNRSYMEKHSIFLVLACLAHANLAWRAEVRRNHLPLTKSSTSALESVESQSRVSMRRSERVNGNQDVQDLGALLLAHSPTFSQAALVGKQMRLPHVVASAPAPARQVWPAADLTPGYAKFVGIPNSTAGIPAITKESLPKRLDPFALVAKDLQPLSSYVPESVTKNKSVNPILTNAASLFFSDKAEKRVRPTMIALLGRVLSEGKLDDELKSRQLQLGQVTEMIHVATVIHDDVFETEETHKDDYARQVAAKVLAGDYLLARASVLLAQLQHTQVVELMAASLDSLVQGQMKLLEQSADVPDYLQKCCLQTASLMANSCKCAALISGYGEDHDLTQAAEKFGYSYGMTYQIVDDILDFKKWQRSNAKLHQNFSTAPILYASEAEPSIKPILERRFQEKGDAQTAFNLAKGTDCIEKSYQLAEFHAHQGLEALSKFPDSENKDALAILMHSALSRKA